jgi:hypothetical protein
MENEEELTVEDIAAAYNALLDSVNFINALDAGELDYMFDEGVDKVDARTRNIDHLTLMVSKDFWTNEDMSAVNAVISVV